MLTLAMNNEKRVTHGVTIFIFYTLLVMMMVSIAPERNHTNTNARKYTRLFGK